jgi:CelD/BcsL family acetyltransferase involved in cellulose biosynthesis
MRVTLHTDFASLASHLAEWNDLAQSVPFRLWQWVDAWWRHYGCETDGRPKPFHELFVLSVWNDEKQLIGIAPWYRLHTRSGARVVRFLGDGEVCSDHLTVLCRPENEATVSNALAEWLTESALNDSVEHNRRWDRLELTGVDADDSPINRLLSELQNRGSLVHHSAALSSWQVALKPTWDEFLMVLSKPHRNRLRRADRNFIQSGRVVVRHVRDENELPAAFDVLISLHQQRWQKRGMPGCFASVPFQAFHRDIAARLFMDGKATIGWLELDGKPLAAEYRFFGGGVAYAYQCGIDTDRLDLKPGELANMVFVRSAIEHGYKTFDFLRGDEPYKAHWRATARPMLAVRVVPDRAAAKLRHTAWLAGQNMKCWIKGGLKRAGLRKDESTAAPNTQKTHHGVTEDTEQQVEV